MRTCLRCQKEYEFKREASKFCSDKCRVAYNRKHPKQGAVSQMQLQVLYNAVLDLVGNTGKPQQTVIAAPKTSYQAPISKPIPQISAQDLMHKFVEARRECTCEDEYRSWLKQLQEDSRLSNKQKELIINTH